MVDQNALNLALCHALRAIDDNYTYDVPEKAAASREVSAAEDIPSIEKILISWDIKGYDLRSPFDTPKTKEVV